MGNYQFSLAEEEEEECSCCHNVVLEGDLSLEKVASCLREGKCKNVVVMVGAGISVAAGIPDFRSPNSGVYATLRKKYNLSDPRDLFTLSCFKEDPKPFYKLVGELFFPSSSDERGTSYRYEPTTVHRFLRLLHEKGVLLRVYTQNIDGLEEAAGLPRYAVVQAHGSFRTASCVACRKPYPQPERVLQLIQHQQRRWQVNLQPDSCSSCSASSSAAADKSTTACQELVIPTCEACSGFVKPDVVYVYPSPMLIHLNRTCFARQILR
ncbi:NAD-dependent protein deacetylase sirtuin-3, mitochondrial [Balamuthia mandrillaris]